MIVESKERFKLLKNQKLAGYLMLKGFVLMKMDNCKIEKGKHIFIFKESEQILSVIDEYYEKYNSDELNKI